MHEMPKSFLQQATKAAQVCISSFAMKYTTKTREIQSHYCTLFEIFIFCPKIQFWQNPNIFPSFSPKFFFFIFFSWNQSFQQLIIPKPQHFFEFFIPKNSTIFSGNQSWIFGQKMMILNSGVVCIQWFMELNKVTCRVH